MIARVGLPEAPRSLASTLQWPKLLSVPGLLRAGLQRVSASGPSTEAAGTHQAPMDSLSPSCPLALHACVYVCVHVHEWERGLSPPPLCCCVPEGLESHPGWFVSEAETHDSNSILPGVEQHPVTSTDHKTENRRCSEKDQLLHSKALGPALLLGLLPWFVACI